MNIIKMAFEILLLLALPVIEANLRYGDAPADASDEEKEELRQKKIAYYNEHSDFLIDEAIMRGAIPSWVGDLAKKLNDVIASMLVRLANYHGYFGHNGNPPFAGR